MASEHHGNVWDVRDDPGIVGDHCDGPSSDGTGSPDSLGTTAGFSSPVGNKVVVYNSSCVLHELLREAFGAKSFFIVADRIGAAHTAGSVYCILEPPSPPSKEFSNCREAAELVLRIPWRNRRAPFL